MRGSAVAWDSALKSCRAKPEWGLMVSGFRHNITTLYNRAIDNYTNNNTHALVVLNATLYPVYV